MPNTPNETKVRTDELAIINGPLSNDDLTLHVSNDFDSDFPDIAGSIRAC